jgi:hypothetical protein
MRAGPARPCPLLRQIRRRRARSGWRRRERGGRPHSERVRAGGAPQRLQGGLEQPRCWPDRGRGRRLRPSRRRGRPRAVPRPLRPARLHRRLWLLPQDRPARGRHAAAAGRRLGPGDLARPGDGLGDLPALPHPAGRGRLRRLAGSRRRGQPGRRAGSHRDQQLLRCAGVAAREALQRRLPPPRARDHRGRRRHRLRALLPRLLPVRHRGRRHQPDQVVERARLERVGLVRQRQRLLEAVPEARGRRTAAPGARSPT